MPVPKPHVYLNAFLAKEEYKENDFNSFLVDTQHVRTYDINADHKMEGKFFVKIPTSKKPKWTKLAEQIIGTTLDDLLNKSNSAVLILKIEENLFAFTFGYGRFLIDHKYFVSDFGIKTALNTLQHDSLRSVDLYTLEDQALQRKAQAVRESEISIFGIDVSRDVLRAVTGTARAGVTFKNISGGDATYSFRIHMNVNELPKIAQQLASYYSLDKYKDNFIWVDNIRRLKDKAKIEELDTKLIHSIRERDGESIIVTVPEIVAWDTIYGFSFTRSKKEVLPTLSSAKYLEHINPDRISIESLKTDRLFIYDINEFETNHSIYKCLYYEVKEEIKTYVFFSGEWYEIDNDFMTRIDAAIADIPTSSLGFPDVYTWKEEEKKKIENEGAYNERTANTYGYNLLDKKLVKSNKTTTPIELCDLLTNNGKFIHVKHRKGGSAGLSHLFAQGNVAAEIMMGDREFRKQARKVLKKINPQLPTILPLDNFKSSDFEIVYLVLGESSDTLKENLPFFSKVNLSKAYESLVHKGYKVSIAGVPISVRSDV